MRSKVRSECTDHSGDEDQARVVAGIQSVIYRYFGPATTINAYKTPEQQDRELAAALYAAGYRKIAEDAA